MIENPNAALVEREPDYPDEAKPSLGPQVRILKGYRYDDPDKVFDKLVQTIETKLVNVDAKLVEGYRDGQPVIKHYRSLREILSNPAARKRVRDAFNDRQVKELQERMVEITNAPKDGQLLREASFDLGLYDDEITRATGSLNVFPITDTILPTTSSPYSKQMLFVDYLDMHRKCLVFNTLVPTLDGTEVTIQELAERGGEVWVYACKDGMVVPAKAVGARFTGQRETVEVVLDSGEAVVATADHPFMLRDGAFCEAGALRPGDRLMPLYRRLSRTNPKGYEQVYHPALDVWESTHHLVARVLYPKEFFAPYSAEDPRHIDHVNEGKRDNRPENIRVLTRSQHFRKTALHPERLERFRQMARRTLPERRLKIAKAQRQTWRDPVVRERRIQGMRAAASNHVVAAVRPGGVRAVYDLTVPGFENFAIGQGIFVHNCFEAATRNPIGKRISKIIPQFVLGRGVKGQVASADHQAAWDEFWKTNRMRLRVKALLRELVIYGEIFLRYFETRKGLVVRSLDPLTIWDIITAPEDLEEVKYYHQQFVILNNSPAVGVFLPASTLIIRHIPADEIDHFKINATSSEKRGRSELYAVLGWLQRFKEFANDRVLLNKMRAMFALDVSVDGGTEDLTTATDQFATPPGPGAVLVHNKAVEVEFKNANNNANEAKTDGELILKIIAVGAGISEQFLGVANAQTRAGALIQTEPDVKSFEDFREIVEEVLIHASGRVWEAKNLPEKEMEFTFPSIAQEDRSTKLKDLALAEAMDWMTKERTATMAAREFEVTTYDYTKEREEIRKERGDEPVIATGYQQLPKQAPATPGGPGEAPGLGADLGPGKPTDQAKPDVTQTSAQMGFKADGGGRGLANTQATLNRPGFTTGGEKAALAGNKSSGTPLRHSATGPRKGWSVKAREISLAVRRARAAQKRAQVMDDSTGRPDSGDTE